MRSLAPAGASLLAVCLASPPAIAQQTAVPEEIRNDSDPTKPVAFSVRNEYYNLQDGMWNEVLILRKDLIVFDKTELPGRARGIIVRGDFPIVTASAGGKTHFGLGDLYAQGLVIPRLGGQFTIAYGTGIVLPTATSTFTGAGKWQLAPAVGPVWFFARRQGFFFLKLQDYFSIAGDGKRPDVNYLLITPAVLYRLTKAWFLLADSESRTDWKRGGQTSFKSGLEIGKMLSPRFGVWIKAEVPWGPHRRGDFTIKLTAFWTRY